MIEEQENKEMQNIEYILALVGDSQVGKTSLFKAAVKGNFPVNPVSTTSINKATLFYHDELNGKLLDTPGQEKWLSITKQYVKNTDGALILYDVTDKTSFEHVDNWIKFLKDNIQDQETYTIFLMGTKTDLLNEGKDKKVGTEDAKSKCKSSGLIWAGEISSKNSTQKELKEKFKELFDIIINNRKNKKEKEKKQVEVEFDLKENSKKKAQRKKIKNVVIVSNRIIKKIKKIYLIELLNSISYD